MRIYKELHKIRERQENQYERICKGLEWAPHRDAYLNDW